MSESKGKFVWYELLTSDTSGAEAFYKTVVGWGARDSGHPNVSYTLFTVGERHVGGLMSLPEDALKGGARPAWIGYISVADVEAGVAAVKAAGGILHRPPDNIPNVGRFAVVADPQGAAFVLFSSANEAPPEVPAGTPGHTGWHELHAGERESAFAFYAGLFGWTKHEALEMGPPVGIYQLFSTGDVPDGGMMTKMDVFPVPLWVYYFNVENIDAATQRIVNGGGHVLHGPIQVPGGSWILQGLDPQGAMFALVGPRP
jgi:predicted enzyme related to lactoylglutathione lyase